jgi:phosphoglycolate phosphatase
MSLPAFRLLVFDWDGTLMDSIATIIACTQAAVRDLGLEPPADAAVRATIGLGLKDSMQRFYPEFDDRLFEPLIERYRQHWLGSFRDEPFLFEGAQDTLRALSAQGFLMAVATAKGRRGLDRELERTGLAPYFHATRTVDEAPSKPHPGMLLGLMEELGARPQETLMIGDTRWDLEMAQNAGTYGLGVLTGSQLQVELETCAPLACLPSVREVPAWLGILRRSEAAPAATGSAEG